MTCKECFITPNLIAWRAVKEIEVLRLDCMICKGKCTTSTQEGISK